MTRPRTLAPHIAAMAVLLGATHGAAAEPALLERGRYMVVTGQCNNCHTAGYSAAKGELPESAWLLGDPKGRREPEGTVYATNLRHYIAALSVEQWILVARNSRSRPPMPWWNLRQTSEQDLRAMYAYIRSLGPVGEPMPPFQPAQPAPAAAAPPASSTR
jgi:mono/diheme cytochrome c family protein